LPGQCRERRAHGRILRVGHHANTVLTRFNRIGDCRDFERVEMAVFLEDLQHGTLKATKPAGHGSSS